MKIKLLLTSILFFLGFALNAQTASMNSSLIEKIDDDADLSNVSLIVKGYGELTNTSLTTESFRWVIEEVDAPDEWEFQLCDANQCFAFDVTSNIDLTIGLDAPLILDANTISIMDFGVKLNGVGGCGTYNVKVTSASDTIVLTESTYVFKINVDENCVALTTNTDEFAKADVKIFPNPTTSFFQITNNEFVSDIEIFNIVGKKMTEARFVGGKSFDISNFPTGLYLVRMIDEDGNILTTTRLTKR